MYEIEIIIKNDIWGLYDQRKIRSERQFRLGSISMRGGDRQCKNEERNTKEWNNNNNNNQMTTFMQCLAIKTSTTFVHLACLHGLHSDGSITSNICTCVSTCAFQCMCACKRKVYNMPTSIVIETKIATLNALWLIENYYTIYAYCARCALKTSTLVVYLLATLYLRDFDFDYIFHFPVLKPHTHSLHWRSSETAHN